MIERQRVIAAVALCLLLAALAAEASAGGLFFRRRVCRSRAVCQPVQVQKVHKVQRVERVVEAEPQQVVNIANVYPSGQTAYSAANVSQIYTANPALAIEAASTATSDATAALRSAIELGATSNAQAVELAKLQAAVVHLQTAVSGSGSGAGSEANISIRQSGTSGNQVERSTDGQGQIAETRSLLSAKCGRCHGSEQAQPAGQLVFDSGVTFEAQQVLRALDILRGNEVPAQMERVVGQLTDAEKSQLMAELLDQWKR